MGLYAEHPDDLDALVHTSPDAQLELDLEAAMAASEVMAAELVATINDALDTCTTTQAEVWRSVTGVQADGTLNQPRTRATVARDRNVTPHTIDNAYRVAHIAVLEAAATTLAALQQLANAHHLLGENPAATIGLHDDRLGALAQDSPIVRPTRTRPAGTHGVRLPSDDDLENTSKAGKERRAEAWAAFHEAQLKRIGRTSEVRTYRIDQEPDT